MPHFSPPRTGLSDASTPSWSRLLGIGASAGGLESLRQLLRVLPDDVGCCYVVLQHMSPSHRSLLAEILAPCCDMPVDEAVDGAVPKANTVLITPSNAHVEWDGQVLRLSTPAPHDLAKPSIDVFFKSLATRLGERAGGIVLSGTGSDGAQGLKQIQEAGGLVLVQSLASARYAGMPDAASRLVGPAHALELAAMGPAVRAWAQAPQDDESVAVPWSASTVEPQRVSVLGSIEQETALLAELGELVRRRCGLNLSDYKAATLARRIERRMQHRHVANLVDYVTLLRVDEPELSALAQSMLISVTSFWRNAAAFDALLDMAKTVLARKPTGESVRVWVAGCATGQEAYTMAMVWAEVLGDRWHEHPLQVFATDLDQDALHVARRGLYPPQVLDDVPEPLRLRYFRPAGAQVEVVRSLRDNIVFSRHDLTRDPPFPRLDMVSCRNVLIYMTASAQDRLLRLFHYALRPEGVLMLGQNESVLHLEHQFKSLSHEVRLYQRLPGRTPLEANRTSGYNAVSPITRGVPRGTRVTDPERDLLRQATALFVPACVLLDEGWRVIHVHGDVSRFLQMRAGPQTLDVQSLSRPEIEGELRLLCAMVGDGAQDAHQVEVSLQEGRKRQRWQLSLHVFYNDQQRRLSLLTFQPLKTRARRPMELTEETLSGQPEGLSVTELLASREQVKLLVEQLETVNEEMRALNEESQAAHEELQASNEELESANEELQATNEELATVNAELNLQSKRHQQLAQELESIQNSITIPLLVIDPNCYIQRYNEAAEYLFRLNTGAQGLHLSTLYHPPGIPNLVALVKETQASASPKVVVLEPGPQGQEYVLQLSHNVLDGQRHGVVLTVLDNTDLARAERQNRLAEQRLVSVLTHGKALMAIKHISGRYEFVNEHYAAFWGVPREQWLGATDAQLLPSEVVTALRQRDIEVLRDHQLLEVQESFTLAGQTRWWWATRFGLFDDEGALEAICIQAVDLTASRQADESLRIAAKVFEVSSEGIMILDPQGNTVRVNAAFCRLTGLIEAQVLGAPPRLFNVDRNGVDFFPNLVRKVTEQGSWQGEVWNARDSGELFPGWLSVSTLSDSQQRPQYIVAVLTDITALNETRENMRHLATHDPLTGFPNRNLLMDRVGHAISHARHHHSEIALCFIDLDHFKTVNDSLGHDVGDDVLRLVARRIADNVRSSDTVARLGGDEFVLLLENTTRLETLQTVERINRALSEHVKLNGNLLSTDASIGIAFYPGDGIDGATLLRNADAAMYRAKNNGRSRYEFFSAEVGDSARNRLRIESGLRQALNQHELLLHYQPQVDACSGEVVGVEALLRWKPAHGELISPSVFLPIAEESLLIDNIGQWVLDEAFAQLAGWRSGGLTQLRLSVNVSSRQLRQRDFAEHLQQLLIKHGLPGECVVLELTESALLQHDDQLNQLLRRLEQLGVQLSLDDFGTGYSSLAYLRRLPLNELKIDRSFVHGVLDRRDDREIVEAILGLGQALGLRVVAEGVETAEQLQHFRRVSADLGIQGFHVAKPMDAQDCEHWLRDAHLKMKMGHHGVHGHA